MKIVLRLWIKPFELDVQNVRVLRTEFNTACGQVRRDMHTSSLLLSSELLSADSASPFSSSSITLRFAIVCSIGSFLECAIVEFRGRPARVKLPLEFSDYALPYSALHNPIRSQPLGASPFATRQSKFSSLKYHLIPAWSSRTRAWRPIESRLQRRLMKPLIL